MGRLAGAFPRKGKLEVTKVDMPDYKVHYPSKSAATAWALALILIVLGSLLAWKIMEDQSDCVYLAVNCPDCSDDEPSASTNKDDLIADEVPIDRVLSTSISNSAETQEPKAEDGLASITADGSTSSTADIMNFLADIIKNLTISISFNEPPAGAQDGNSSDAGIKLQLQDGSLIKPDESMNPISLFSFFMPPIPNLFGFLESDASEATETVPSSTVTTETVTSSTATTEIVTSLITETTEAVASSTEDTEEVACSTEPTETVASTAEAASSPSISTEETTTGKPEDQEIVKITWIPVSSNPENHTGSLEVNPDVTGRIPLPAESVLSSSENKSLPVEKMSKVPIIETVELNVSTQAPSELIPDDPASLFPSNAQLNSTSERTESVDLKPETVEVEPTENIGTILDGIDPEFPSGKSLYGSAQLTSSSEEFSPNENVSLSVDNGTKLVPSDLPKVQNDLPELINLGSNETAVHENFTTINVASSGESGEDDDRSPDDFFPAWFFKPLGLLRAEPRTLDMPL